MKVWWQNFVKKHKPTPAQKAKWKAKLVDFAKKLKPTPQQKKAMRAFMVGIVKKLTPTQKQKAAMKAKMKTIADATKKFAKNGANAAWVQVQKSVAVGKQKLKDATVKAKESSQEAKTSMKKKFQAWKGRMQQKRNKGVPENATDEDQILRDGFSELKGYASLTAKGNGTQQIPKWITNPVTKIKEFFTSKGDGSQSEFESRWKATFDQWKKPKLLVGTPSAAFTKVDTEAEHDPNRVVPLVWRGAIKPPCKNQLEVPLEEWVQSSYMAAETAVGEGLVLAVVKIIEDSLGDDECPGRVMMIDGEYGAQTEISLQAEAVAHAAVRQDGVDDATTNDVLEEELEIAAAIGEGGRQGLSDVLEENCEEDPVLGGGFVEAASGENRQIDPRNIFSNIMDRLPGKWYWKPGKGEVDDEVVPADVAQDVAAEVVGETVNQAADAAMEGLVHDVGGADAGFLEVEPDDVSAEAETLAEQIYAAGWIAACGELPEEQADADDVDIDI